jgi:hypothetical protein
MQSFGVYAIEWRPASGDPLPVDNPRSKRKMYIGAHNFEEALKKFRDGYHGDLWSIRRTGKMIAV